MKFKIGDKVRIVNPAIELKQWFYNRDLDINREFTVVNAFDSTEWRILYRLDGVTMSVLERELRLSIEKDIVSLLMEIL